MRRFAIFTLLSLMISFAGFAQTGGLKGPKAKNYKPWENPKPPKPILVAVVGDVKGPEAKNMRPLENTKETKVVRAKAPKERLMGPRAKNRKPWEKKDD